MLTAFADGPVYSGVVESAGMADLTLVQITVHVNTCGMIAGSTDAIIQIPGRLVPCAYPAGNKLAPAVGFRNTQPLDCGYDERTDRITVPDPLIAVDPPPVHLPTENVQPRFCAVRIP